MASRVPFWVAFWRLFRTAFWVPFWVPSPEGSFLEANRTIGACFLHRISLPYRRSLFFTPNASENASRTGGGLFEHGTHIRYRRRPSPVPSAVEGAGEGSAGDKFRVSGTKGMVEVAGANKESGAVSRTEDASGGQVLLLARRASEMRPVWQWAVHSLWSRLFCGPLKMRSV